MDLMVSAIGSGSRGLGSRPGHVMFIGKTLYSHSMSLNCKEKEHVYYFPELYLK